MKPYQNNGPLDCTTDIDDSRVSGKSVIVTGGANGLGEAYVRAFVAAGAFVTVADIEEDAGTRLVEELKGKTQFVRCDVTQWADQVKVFKKAISESPSKRVDIVVANAGISGPDAIFRPDDSEEPKEPNLKILNINLTGVMLSTKLALHYFKRQHDESPADTCLILQASLAGYLDLPGAPQYQASKYGLRGLMCCLRQTAWQQGTRVNCISPWFIPTRIMSAEVVKQIKSTGTSMASADDAASAVIMIAGDSQATGRSIAIVPREWAPRGYMDLDHDDYKDGDPLREWSNPILKASPRVVVPDDQQ